MAAMQRRRGPNAVGFWGLLQPLADGLKLMAKEGINPWLSVTEVYRAAPILCLIPSFLSWVLLPLYPDSINYPDSDISFLMFTAITTIGSFGVILAGWGSFSRYAMMGALRAIAQLISYEVVFLLTVSPIAIYTSSFSFFSIVENQINGYWNFFLLMPSAIIFFILILAETNRTPFDLPEAEAELVSGFNVEYSSIFFAMFFLAEYNNILLMSTLYTILFLGGWSLGFMLFIFKIILVAYFIIMVRAALPRYRYDQLMFLCWRVFLPLILGLILFYLGVANYFGIYALNEVFLFNEVHKIDLAFHATYFS